MWGANITNNEMFKTPDGRIKSEGDQIVNQKLAETFRKIANDKWAFHRGNSIYNK